MQTGNWIDGRWTGARKKDSYQPELRFASETGRGAWPRCGAEDFADALDSLQAGAAAWQAMHALDRRDCLERALDDWQADGKGVDVLAEGLGLETGQLDGELERALDCGDRMLSAAGDAEHSAAPLVARIAADQMYEGLVRALFPALLAGSPVLLLADADLPWLAQEFVRQLAKQEALGDAVVLLHDDRRECEALARTSDFFGLACFSRAPAPGSATRRSAQKPRVASRGFGAGVLQQAPASEQNNQQSLCLQPSANSTLIVTLDMDPRQAARSAWRAALDPIDTLSGQRDGQVGRIVCHERHVSEFTRALLEEVDAAESDLHCRRFISGLSRHVERLCRLGLDEGATLLRGEPEDGTGQRANRRNGLLVPTIFTNVEPNMALVQSTEPAPVLSILRARNDSEAVAIRDLFDALAKPPHAKSF